MGRANPRSKPFSFADLARSFSRHVAKTQNTRKDCCFTFWHLPPDRLISESATNGIIHSVRFPQTFIDDLKRQADIVRIVQDYVPLKKAGANWRAPCPFHKETKPSFNVNPSKEMFNVE